jgi:hypothetical protein
MLTELLPNASALVPALALEIEERLVRLDQRGMGRVREEWRTGYLNEAVDALFQERARVLIVSGFPIGETFETDGPAGALVLASALREFGSEVALAGLPTYLSQLREGAALMGLEDNLLYQSSNLESGADASAPLHRLVEQFRPTLLVFVEVPGSASDGNYYNMRRENISARTFDWELLLSACNCPSIAFADGGNELGMGRVGSALRQLDIEPAVSATDHLVISDVSNWGVYGAVALASARARRDLFPSLSIETLLQALNLSGIVDGVTGAATPTEDGLPAARGEGLIRELRQLAASAIAGSDAMEHSLSEHSSSTVATGLAESIS